VTPPSGCSATPRWSPTEARAIGNTNATGGSGGELAPPTWLVNEWINLLRPGRVTADLFKKGADPGRHVLDQHPES
jgi:hypothetical protein